MGHINVRKACRDDRHWLVAWNAAMALETEAKVLDQAILERGVAALFEVPQRGFYLFAERDGEPVGSLLLTYEWSDWRNADFWWLQSVYVVPAARRCGVFSALYQHAQAAACAAGAAGLRLYVERDNATAQAAYVARDMRRCRYRMYERYDAGH